MRLLTTMFIIFVFINGLLFINHLVYGDRGGISPIGERVTESGQKAIIAWNGTREVLLLSTDVSSSNESEVVEIMPLPSNPTISKGEEQSFQKIKELVNTYFFVTTSRDFHPLSILLSRSDEYAIPTVTIVFQELIGVHNLTVVNAENSQDLLLWLSVFLETEGYFEELPNDMEGLLDHYMQSEMHFFVIDIIQTNSTVKTVDPLIYEFNSSKLYYPLKISTLFYGDTDISLFTITSNELNDNPILEMGFAKKAQFKIKHGTLTEIHTNITALFSTDPHLCYFSFKGALNSFQGDIWVNSTLGLDTFSVAVGLTIVCLGTMLSVFSIFKSKSGSALKNLYHTMLRQPIVISFILGLAGLVLTLSSLVLPLGLGEFGSNGEVLIDINGVFISVLTASGTADILFSMSLFLSIYFYAYLLFHKSSKGASLMLIVGGAYMLFHVLSSYVLLYSIGIGMYTILIGISSLILAGFLSLSVQIRSINPE